MSTTGNQSIYYCNKYAMYCTGANERGECNTTACWNRQWTRLNYTDTPATDIVGVVRCKDCKHRDPDDKKCNYSYDILWQLPRVDNWFCADGERR